jgi:cellulose synthase/poly-beta-1,6-N-acetylglucosamine synthase-like glycosyltransferase
MWIVNAAWALHLTALGVLAVYGAHRAWLVAHAWRQRRIEPPAAPIGDVHPHVTVQLPIYNEPEVAARLIDAACRLEWPRDRLEIQVLDDSTDDTTAIVAARVAAWRAEGVDAVHVRRDDRAGWKAGALEAGRARARGELLLVLDADFVAPPRLLVDAVGHFADPAVGMVQLRWDHLNRASTPLTQIEALLLDGHFAIEQRGRAHRGCAFNFNGTAGVWRASAIADAGGWHADTLTEDLDLSYRAALRGWRFVLVTARGVPAELPARMPAFRGQQFRWAKGSIEVARKLGPALVRAPWPWWHRVEALFHVTHNVPYLATAVLVVTSAVTLGIGGGPAWAGPLQIAAAAITAIVIGGYAIASQSILGRRGMFAALLRTPPLVALTAGISLGQARAVLEGATGHRSEFVRTPKDGVVGAEKPRRGCRRASGWFEIVTACGLAAGCAAALSRGAIVESMYLIVFSSGLAWVGLASIRDW